MMTAVIITMMSAIKIVMNWRNEDLCADKLPAEARHAAPAARACSTPGGYTFLWKIAGRQHVISVSASMLVYCRTNS